MDFLARIFFVWTSGINHPWQSGKLGFWTQNQLIFHPWFLWILDPLYLIIFNKNWATEKLINHWKIPLYLTSFSPNFGQLLKHEFNKEFIKFLCGNHLVDDEDDDGQKTLPLLVRIGKFCADCLLRLGCTLEINCSLDFTMGPYFYIERKTIGKQTISSSFLPFFVQFQFVLRRPSFEKN